MTQHLVTTHARDQCINGPSSAHHQRRT